MTQSELPAFATVQAGLRGALVRALRVQAHTEDRELPPTLAEQVAQTPGESQGDADLRALFTAPPLALVRFDTPGIQSYLFQARRQVDVLGGSHLVEAFTDPDTSSEISFYRHLADGRVAIPATSVIYAGGGGGLILVAACEAEAVVERLMGVLEAETAGDLQTVAAYLRVWPLDLAEVPPGSSAGKQPPAWLGPSLATSRYAATTAALDALCQRQRSTHAGLIEPVPPERYIERCHSCGRGVGRESPFADGEPQRICSGCEARRAVGRNDKKLGGMAKNFPSLVENLPDESLAVLYADGANVGGAFLQVGSMEQHRALSLAVDRAMASALAVVEGGFEWLQVGEWRRVQTPLRGGDDLVIVLPAMAAVRLLVPLIETFEGAFDLAPGSLLGDAVVEGDLRQRIGGFGMGIGLAIADARFPIQFLFGYAKSLLHSAKKRIDPGAGVRSAIDFLVLRSGCPLSHSIETVRAEHYHRPLLEPVGEPRASQGTGPEAVVAEPELLLTRRPYSLAEWKELERGLEAFSKVSPSQIHAIRREIDRGFFLSRSLWRYQHARAAEGSGWAAFRETLGCPLEEVDRLLWREVGKNTYTTDFIDAFELVDTFAAPAPAAPKAGGTP